MGMDRGMSEWFGVFWDAEMESLEGENYLSRWFLRLKNYRNYSFVK